MVGIQPLRVDDPRQVYIYVGPDRGPTEFNPAFGMAWGIGGWLLTSFLQKVGSEAAQKLRERIAREIKTTFASIYTKEVSLAEALQPRECTANYRPARSTSFYPNKGLH